MFKNIEKKIFIPTFLTLIIFILLIRFFPKETKNIISYLFNVCTEKFGWLYLVVCLLAFVFMFCLTFSKYGNVKLGDPGEVPRYNNMSWIAMLFTSGVGSSLVILGFLEPIYYVSSPPFQIEPFSQKAFEYAHMYGQFHWGPSAWALYNPAIIAIAYMLFVKKENKLRLSTACKCVLGKRVDGLIGNIIDILVVFGVVGGISTSLGISAPVIADIIRHVFKIPNQYELIVQITVLLIWVVLFGSAVYLGLDKGIQKLSNINVILAFGFMVILLLVGPTVDIFKMEVSSIGLYLQDFWKMSTYADPFGDGIFTKNWTVFYWGWWLAFMPMMGMFVGNISRGRTIRNVMWGQLIWGSLGCCVSFMIFGGYSLYLQYTGTVDVAFILETQGQSAALMAILETLPLKNVMMVYLCIVCFVYLATTVDSCAYVLAGTTTKNLSCTDEPARWNRILWAILFCTLSIGLMMIDGLEAVKTMSILTGLPLIGVLILLMVSVRRMLINSDNH